MLVHGLWMSGFEMVLLRLRLRREGYHVVQFRYRTSRRDFSENVRRLQQFLATTPGESVHFVAHSLGGLVVRQLFHDFPGQRPGRIVTLGSPHSGSGTARCLARHSAWRHAMGEALSPLSGALPEWQGQRELGSIAGTMSLGISQLLRNLPLPNDGTVAAVETQLADSSDYLELPVSHSGLLFSREVAQQTAHFLAHGHFQHSRV